MLSHRILEGLSFNKIKNCYITDLENKLTVARETRIGRLQDMYTQLYSEWVTNKEMYSTCNSILCGSLDGSGV